jgi:hypothetical protein
MNKTRTIFGIDFSGAQNAGNKIWVSRGIFNGKGLLIEKCFRARELEQSGTALDDCLPALVNLIKSDQKAAFGLDFPFGIHKNLVPDKTWEDFVTKFPKKYKSPDEFRDSCREVDRGRELKRYTDKVSHAPFSPYNLRLFKQTYYGIAQILFPLIQDDAASVLPFHEPVDGKPWVLEICPASTLNKLDLNGMPYKGRTERHKENRIQILREISKAVSLIINHETAIKIIADKGGDALDSVIATLATYNTISNQNAIFPDDDSHWKIEGYVYV